MEEGKKQDLEGIVHVNLLQKSWYLFGAPFFLSLARLPPPLVAKNFVRCYDFGFQTL